MTATDDVKYVQMPWHDKKSIIYQGNLYTRWNLIQKQLGTHISDVDSLINAIRSYNVVFSPNGSQSTTLWSFRALREVINSMDADERDAFFCELGILHAIRKLALMLPETCPKLKWLVVGVEDSQTLHQIQIASILANAFMCTFPKRGSGEPSINFNTLFDGKNRHVQKLKCIIHYFRRVHDKQPKGCLTFHRRCTAEGQYPRWDRTNVKLCSVTADDAGRIEDQVGHLQMDFANRVLGGGVLTGGCVQEEIRFIICPELIAARLFIQPMTDNEACIIIGAERYCNYSGYANDFQFLSDYKDETPFDEHNRRNVHILAVDATFFRLPVEQFREGKMLREIKKIYTGLTLRDGDLALPLATGNWGCGVYNGDPEFKSLLQIIAASQAGRTVAYFTFGNKNLRDNLLRMHAKLVELNISVGLLYRILILYWKDRRPHQSVFKFVAMTAERYANAYVMSRLPVRSDDRDNAAVSPDVAVSSDQTLLENPVQSCSQPRNDSTWIEKEKPAASPQEHKPVEQKLSQELAALSHYSYSSDDFIPSTPDQKKYEAFKNKPGWSLMDCLEDEERKETPDQKKHKELFTNDPGLSLLDFLDEEERKETEGTKRIRRFNEFDHSSPSLIDTLENGESLPKEGDTVLYKPWSINTGEVASSSIPFNSGKKLSQTKIDHFFKK